MQKLKAHLDDLTLIELSADSASAAVSSRAFGLDAVRLADVTEGLLRLIFKPGVELAKRRRSPTLRVRGSWLELILERSNVGPALSLADIPDSNAGTTLLSW